MSDIPRPQRIAALLAISAVVLVTLVVVQLTRSPEAEDNPVVTIDPEATPTSVPVLSRPQIAWDSAIAEVRGAGGMSPPVPCPIVDERTREPNNFISLTPALTFVCDIGGLNATPVAPGRVVMTIDQVPLNSQKADLVANGKDGPWIRAAAYGPFVVVDHGSLNGVGNVSSVYAGLDGLNPDLRVGQRVETTTPLGRIGARRVNGETVAGVLSLELLTDDTRFGSDPLRSDPPRASDAAVFADRLAPAIGLPVATCNLPFGSPDLNVGAPRTYRSGTHNGLDFNCGTVDHTVVSAAAGEVLFVVDDFVEPDPEDRLGVLAGAADASDTPFWTLAMLYGNFVVVAHPVPDSSESAEGDRVVTIYAHLSEVDEAIVTGRRVDAGTRIGAVGNTGTSTAANGIFNAHPSVHLHWELHVNDRAVGYLSSPAETEPLYRKILCEPAPGAAPAC